MGMYSIVCYRCMWKRSHREATYSSSTEPGNLGSPLDASVTSMKWAASGNGNRLKSHVEFLNLQIFPPTKVNWPSHNARFEFLMHPKRNRFV